MSMPLISIIMPCYNSEVFIEESVASVFRQTYPNIQLIIVDDGSTDHSPHELASLVIKHPTLTLLQQPNSGPYPARNLALQRADGEFICFLDADDYWSPDFLEELYRGLIEADADLSYCGWQNIVEAGQNSKPYIPPSYEKGDIIDSFLKGCPWPIHAALVKRSIVDQVDGFSVRRFSSMDYDFWLRIIAVTQNIVRVPKALAFYRWHNQGQISSVKWRQVIESWNVRNDFIHTQSQLVAHIPKEQLRELTDGFIYSQAYDAFWKGDLISAQRLFRTLLQTGYWKIRDLRYILPSLFPALLFKGIVGIMRR